MTDTLLRPEFSWPDLAGRHVLLIGLGEGDVATGALSTHPAIRAATRVEFAELRGPSPQMPPPAAEGLTHVRRAASGRLLLIDEPGLAEELATRAPDLLVVADLGGPTDHASVRRVLDILRRTGREGLYVLLGPGAQGALEAEALQGVLAGLVLTEAYAGAAPLEPLRARLRRANGPSLPERVAAFLGNAPTGIDGLGRVQVPGHGFPWIPAAPLERMLVFRTAGEGVLTREEALSLVLRVTDRETLGEVARRHPSRRVRLQAALGAASDAVWVALLQADPDPGVRREAAKQVRRVPALQAALARDDDAEVRALARSRLRSLQAGSASGRGGDRATRLVLALAPMLGTAERNPALAVTLLLLVLGLLGAGGWLVHGAWRAAEYFETGSRLEEKAAASGLLWYARAVERRPSYGPYREAAARILLGRPSLVFGRPLPEADLVAVSPDGQTVARASGRTLHLAEPREMPAPMTGLCFAPDTGALVVALEASGVRVITGEAVQALPHPRPIRLVQAAPGGRVATADAAGVFRLWQGDRLAGQAAARGVIAAVDAERGRWAVVRKGEVEVWTLGRAQPVLLPQAERPFRDVCLEPGGSRLGTLDTSGLAEIWEPLTLGWNRRGAGKEATALEFLPEGREVVALQGGVARVTRTVGAPRPQTALLPPGAREVTFSADGSTVAAWGPEGGRVARSGPLRRPLEPLPDLDEPSHLLDLEARLYTGQALGWDGKPEALGKADLAVAWEEWRREGEAHARECAWPSANLWLLMTR